MDILTKLFGSAIKVKLMRLFIFNESEVFELDSIVTRIKAPRNNCRRELDHLYSVGLIKKREITKEVQKKSGKRVTVKKIKVHGYVFNQSFPYSLSLKNLLAVASLDIDSDLKKRILSMGRIKLLLIAGLFIQDWDSRVDILVVGDDIPKARMDQLMNTIESELGKEITYTVLDTAEFEYRLNIHDKLIRDILDYPHRVLVDKIGLKQE